MSTARQPCTCGVRGWRMRNMRAQPKSQGGRRCPLFPLLQVKLSELGSHYLVLFYHAVNSLILHEFRSFSKVTLISQFQKRDTLSLSRLLKSCSDILLIISTNFLFPNKFGNPFLSQFTVIYISRRSFLDRLPVGCATPLQRP